MIASWLCQTGFENHTLLLHVQLGPGLHQYVILLSMQRVGKAKLQDPQTKENTRKEKDKCDSPAKGAL